MSLMDDLRASQLQAVAGRIAIYNGARKYFTLMSLITCPFTFFVDAPFGRFTRNEDSIFTVDGIKSWMVMETVSPLFFLATFYTSPLSLSPENSKNWPQLILAACFVIHYTNRAVVSPLRTPSRSKSHLMVPASAVLFNIVNGSLMGSYLSSRGAQHFLSTSFSRPSFYVGLGLWVAGFLGNIVHDEILLNIRRKSKRDGSKRGNSSNKEHYGIPSGYLYKYISYPNYFCEWFEWAGYAMAASPIPWSAFLSPSYMLAGVSSLSPFKSSETFAGLLTPPWIFVLSEVVLMLPRAVKGHKWYHDKFGERYPKERKAVIPYVL